MGYKNDRCARNSVLTYAKDASDIPELSKRDPAIPKCLCGSCLTCFTRLAQAALRQGDRAGYREYRRHYGHLRRSIEGKGDVTPSVERELRRRSRTCPICECAMTDDPHHPNSKQLDHIHPIGAGGTHTVGNVRIICARCNQSRPHDGSDWTGQSTLWAATPGANPIPGHVPTKRAERAYVLSLSARSWSDVAEQAGYPWNTSAQRGAAWYARHHDLPLTRIPHRFREAATRQGAKR